VRAVPAPRPFRFALQALPRADRAAWQDVARQAEDLGYATLQTADHLGLADPLLPLVSAADVTTSLRFAPLVLNNELHNPVLLARQAATVDLLTDGRLELGIGTGYAETEHQAAGIPLSPPKERVDRLAAALTVLPRLFAGDAVELDGPYRLAVAAEALGLRCVQQPHPPILVGGYGRRVIGLAARAAQIVQFTGLAHDPDGTPRPRGFARATLDERVGWLRESAGARLAELELSVLVQRVHEGDPAIEVSAVAARLGMEDDVVRTSPFLLFGTVDAMVEQLEEQRATLGISYVTVREAELFAPVVARLAGT